MDKQLNDPTLFSFFTEIGIIDQLARAKLESLMPDGLKVSHFAVLNHMAISEGEWSPLRLATALQVTKGAITNTLQRLEARDLINIIANPNDARGKLVTLTSTGLKVREQCILNTQPLLDDLEKEFGLPEFASHLPFIESIRKFLDKERDS